MRKCGIQWKFVGFVGSTVPHGLPTAVYAHGATSTTWRSSQSYTRHPNIRWGTCCAALSSIQCIAPKLLGEPELRTLH